MSETRNKLIKNKPAILLGGGSALILVLFGLEFLQFYIAVLADAGNTALNFSYFFPAAEYTINESSSDFINYFVMLTPIIVSITFLQVTSLLLFRFPLGFYRYSLMIFQLIILGYLLLYLLYSAISVALNFSWNTDFQKFTNYLHTDYPFDILVVFVFVFLIAMFININAKKVTRFINK